MEKNPWFPCVVILATMLKMLLLISPSQYVEDLAFGLYAVRGAMSQESLLELHVEIKKVLENIALRHPKGQQATAVQGRVARKYANIKAVDGHCTCKYDNAATARHDVHKFNQ